MARYLVIMAALVMATAFNCGVGWTADQQMEQDRTIGQDEAMNQERLRDQDIYGWELMTVEERNEHRKQISSLKTEQEREQYRQEHHAQMQERARAQGRTLPDLPDLSIGGAHGMGSGGMGSGGMGGRGR